MEQPVNLQQTLAVDVHAIAFDGQEPPVGNALERFGKTIGGVGSEFVGEILQAHRAKLELQNKFSNEPFIITGRQRAVYR